MPATEKTWRDNRTMHVIFACTSVVLLAVSVWMMVDDHYNRPWKDYTKGSIAADTWMATHRRIQFQTREYIDQQRQLEERLSDVRSSPPDHKLLDSFVAVAGDCAAALPEAPLDVDNLKDKLDRLRKVLTDRLNGDVNGARTDFDKAQEAVAVARKKLDDATIVLAKVNKDAEKAAKSKDPDAKTKLATAQANIKSVTESVAEGHLALQSAEQTAEIERKSKLDAERVAGDDRDKLLGALQEVIGRIKTYEENTDTKRKVESANYDEARSDLDLGNAHGDASAEQSEKLQDQVDLVKKRVDDMVAVVEIAKAHRDRLKQILATLSAGEEDLKKQIVTHEASLVALHTQVTEGSDSWLRRMLAWPIIDIFGKGDNSIDQYWIPKKTLNFNFAKVARFDRCISCHRSILKTFGGATTPSFLPESHITLTLRTPAAAPPLNADDRVLGLYFSDEEIAALQGDEDDDSEAGDPRVRRAVMLIQAYGLGLVQGGPLNNDDVAVSFAWPKSLAAKAGLQTGDVIERIDGAHVPNLGVAQSALVDRVTWGQPITLDVRRGVPNPYSTHPRLDLYGTAASPHPFGKMGCTLCHDGQGSATDFINAVHIPDSEVERAEWVKKYGWSKNHHWPFPMYPERFREASCLKCHHDVTELEPSERFPEPPAPKLIAGYNLVRRYGCFGCHEINGFDGPAKRIGPDLRAEPNYSAAAKQILFRLRLPERLPPFVAKQKELAGELASLQKPITLADLEVNTIKRKDDELSNQAKLLDEDTENLRKAAIGLRYDAKKSGAEPDQAQLDKIQAKLDKNKADRTENQKTLDEIKPQRNLLAKLQAVSERLADWHLAEEKALAVAKHPDDNVSRRRLLEVVSHDAKRDKSDPLGFTFSETTRNVASVLQDTDTPGSFRKVGPSLRHAGEKLSLEFLTAWLEDPTHFRPDTRMPRFYGLHDHMQAEIDRKTEQLEQLESEEADEESLTAAKEGLERANDKLQDAKRFERVEIRAIAYYLLKNSQPFDHVEQTTAPKTAPGSPERKLAVERGKQLFAERGCLACHSKKDHSKGKADQGPDLSQIGAKLRLTDNGKVRKWLYSWVRQPNRYHARTVMPDLFLDEPTAPLKDGTPTDAAADITEYLMDSGDWKPKNDGQPNWPPLADPAEPTAADAALLDHLQELTDLHLAKALRSERLSTQYLAAALEGGKSGQATAERIAGAFRADETALTGLTDANKADKMLDYIGRRTLSHRGCFGCHDIPGYEGAKPIGTELADWGRKDPSKLAYEQIAGYLHQKEAGHDNHEGSGHASHASEESLDDFFIRGLVSHHEATRESFLWQKLREPRSFDYNKTENKAYLDQLRMPQFNFSSDQREQIMTFVLGLVAEPPGDTFVYKPNPRRKAILEGSKVLAQFNCAGCHSLSKERWEVTYQPGQFASTMKQPTTGYAFLDRHWTAEEIEASLQQEDLKGQRHATLIGEPQRDAQTGELLDVDEDRQPIPAGNEEGQTVHYNFRLWQPALLDGLQLRAGEDAVLVPRSQVTRHEGVGGEFARLLRTRLRLAELASAGIIAPARDQEISASVPPPLVGEGRKVQGDWLHDFMLAPYRIRPAVVLRMPRFTMSPEEATKIVNYFAALDNAEYPYESDPRTRQPLQKKLDREYLKQLTASLSKPEFDKRFADHQAKFYGDDDLRLGDAMRIVVDRNFCVTCHRVGDFTPPKTASGQAPNLADVGRRLRPDYVRRWIANPKRLLPYTAMPQNIKPTEPLKPSLYHGTSPEQLDALVDLLMNFDRYMKRRTSISKMVPAAIEVGAAPKKVVPPP